MTAKERVSRGLNRFFQALPFDAQTRWIEGVTDTMESLLVGFLVDELERAVREAEELAYRERYRRG